MGELGVFYSPNNAKRCQIDSRLPLSEAERGRGGEVEEGITMIVLSRKKNESVRIGDVVITVVEMRGDKVRLGVEAPKDASVHRQEVWEALYGHRFADR